MYEGPNRNGSYFTRTIMDKMASTIGGIPVVGQYSEEQGDFLEHGELIVSIVDGDVKVAHEGPSPYGFVPHDAKVWYESHLDKDGVERVYMTTYVYLWTGRYKELEILKYGRNNQSMELDPNTFTGNFQMIGDQNLFVVDNAEFNALCLLGAGVEPAFEGAGVEYVNYNYSKPFADKLQDMKKELHAVFNLHEEEQSEVEEMEKDKLQDPNIEENLNEDIEDISEDLENELEEEEIKDEIEEDIENKEEEDLPEFSHDEDEEEVDSEEEEELEDSEELEEDSELEEDEEEALDEEVEPSEEDLKDIEEHLEEVIGDDELDELIAIGSEIDNDPLGLEADFAKLKEEYDQVVEELNQYKLKETRAEKALILEKYKSDIEENDFRELFSKMDNYSLEDLETKAQAVAYATLKNIIDLEKALEPKGKTSDFSLKSGVSMNVDSYHVESKEDGESTLPTWALAVINRDKQ